MPSTSAGQEDKAQQTGQMRLSLHGAAGKEGEEMDTCIQNKQVQTREQEATLSRGHRGGKGKCKVSEEPKEPRGPRGVYEE